MQLNNYDDPKGQPNQKPIESPSTSINENREIPNLNDIGNHERPLNQSWDIDIEKGYRPTIDSMDPLPPSSDE